MVTLNYNFYSLVRQKQGIKLLEKYSNFLFKGPTFIVLSVVCVAASYSTDQTQLNRSRPKPKPGSAFCVHSESSMADPELTPSRTQADREHTQSGHRKQTPNLEANP